MSVLLLKINNQLAETIQETLTEINEEIVSFSDYQRAFDEVKNNKIESIICRFKQDDPDLFRFVNLIRGIKKFFPAILLIASNDDLKKIKNDLPDFDDIIVKPFTVDELVIRIRKMKDLSALKNQSYLSKKNMLKLSREDPLTGFLNRRAILDEALKEMNRSARGTKFISSMMVNISNFKELTADYESELIDNILFEFSRRLYRSCRPYDKIGRYGITEYLIILPDTSEDESMKVAERIIAATAVKNINIRDKKINLEINIGLSQLDPDDVAKAGNIDDSLMNDLILDALLKRTEIAMNNAGKKGTNLIERYSI